jgi:hypothetical protein
MIRWLPSTYGLPLKSLNFVYSLSVDLILLCYWLGSWQEEAHSIVVYITLVHTFMKSYHQWRLFFNLGDDVGRPQVFTTSCAPSPTRHTKVRYSPLCVPTITSMEWYATSYYVLCLDSDTSTSMERSEDAWGLKVAVTEACKRRQNKNGHTSAWTGMPDRTPNRSGASPGAVKLTTEANCMMSVRSPVHAETLYWVIIQQETGAPNWSGT